MKKLFLTTAVFFTFTIAAFAQVDNGETQQEDIDDKIQQEPPRETQRTLERTTTQQADITTKNAQNVRAAEEKIKKEKEKSTGKESTNPATTNTRTGKPAKMTEPVKQRN